MTLFYLKLTITPLLMWAISLASRRWGGLLGGLLSGLPITSALVMTFLCLEQGTAFALGALPGALGGLRGLAHLTPVLMNLQCWVAPKQFALPKAFEAFDPNGQLSLESNRTALHGVVDQVLWAARKFQA